MPVGAWFATDFDVPAEVLTLPAEVTSGQQGGVCVVDQVVRGTGIVGRISGDFGAVALKVRADGQPVRVAVVVHLDELATRWWSDRVRPGRNEPERPRVVLVRSQGRVRGAALLARRQGWLGAAGAQATVEFDLAAQELDHDGLLVVELGEPQLPGWAVPGLSARGALGLRINRISVRPQPHPTAGTPSPAAAPTLGAEAPPGASSPQPGKLPGTSPQPDKLTGDGVGEAETGCPFAVVGAGETLFGLVSQIVAPAPPTPRSPTNRWTRRKPARAAFKALRISRRMAGRAAATVTPHRRPVVGGVHAADLTTGEPLGIEILDSAGPVLRLRLTAPAPGPVLIGVADAPSVLSCRVVDVR